MNIEEIVNQYSNDKVWKAIAKDGQACRLVNDSMIELESIKKDQLTIDNRIVKVKENIHLLIMRKSLENLIQE